MIDLFDLSCLSLPSAAQKTVRSESSNSLSNFCKKKNSFFKERQEVKKFIAEFAKKYHYDSGPLAEKLGLFISQVRLKLIKRNS